MKKFLLGVVCIIMPLAQAGIHSNPTLLQRAKQLARQALKSRATPFVLGGIALSTIPYKKLFRDTMQNYAYDAGSSYGSKWLPWPMGMYIKEWNRARLREQMQIRVSYALIGAAVTMMLMQQTDASTQQPMIVNKIIVNNGSERKTVDTQRVDESDYLDELDE